MAKNRDIENSSFTYQLSTRPQDGVIALFMAIVLGLLLLVTTTSAARLQVSEISQSSQIDRSEQAYYAAEAGIEEALLRIKNNPTGTLQQVFPEQYSSVCGSNLRGAQSELVRTNGDWVQSPTVAADCSEEEVGQLAWRSRKVTLSSSIFSGTQVKDESTQFDASDLRRTMPTGTYGANGLDYDGASIFSHFTGLEYCWTNNKSSAELELSMVSWPSGNINVSRTEKVIVPSSSAFSRTTLYGTVQTTAPGSPYSYCLTFNITDQNRRYIFRIRPIFSAAGSGVDAGTTTQNSYSINYRAKLKSSPEITGSPLYLPDDSYLIDVVGQSGGIRRRLVAKKQKTGRLIGIFDYVLYSGNTDNPLCKAGVQQSDTGYSLLCQLTNTVDNSAAGPPPDAGYTEPAPTPPIAPPPPAPAPQPQPDPDPQPQPDPDPCANGCSSK